MKARSIKLRVSASERDHLTIIRCLRRTSFYNERIRLAIACLLLSSATIRNIKQQLDEMEKG